MSRGKNIRNTKGHNSKYRATPMEVEYNHDHSIYLDYDYLNAAKKTMALPKNPEKVMVVGDLHGDLKHLNYIAIEAQKRGIKVLVQVGDLGYWPHTDPNYIKDADKILKAHDLHIIAIDGNHENFAALNAPRPEHQGFKILGQRVLYAPRGTVWEWQGKKILAMGGASSIDKKTRLADEEKSNKPYKRTRWLWWAEENITDNDVNTVQDIDQVDILITHDCPSSVNLSEDVMRYKEDPQTFDNRQKLQRVLEMVKPKLLYHGHYHARHSSIGGGWDWGCQVEGMGRNSQGADSWVELDLTQDLPEL